MKQYPLKTMVWCLGMIWSQQYAWAQNINDTAVQENARQAELNAIEVRGERNKDEIGKNRVYAREVVNLYKGKAEVETYKGNTVSDLLGGLVGVYSGDARNSGALDPNIRGVQGQGRIPVTIDGTEQAITVWRGYSGANNRNYVDPNIISSVYVEKGPSFSNDIKSGIGGGVALKTIDADDIVKAGEKYGFEFKAETADNSIAPRDNAYSHSVDYRTLPEPAVAVGGIWRAFFDDSERVGQRFEGRHDLGKDKAYRIAAATKQDHFDAMIAYAYRDKGNYFSGKKGAQRYGYIGPMTPENLEHLKKMQEEAAARGEKFWGSENMLGAPNVSRVGLFFYPGGEVTNTSLHTESWVGKTTWRLPDNQTVKLGYRNTDSTFGEVMPSRIIGPISNNENLNKVTEWPKSWVKQKSYNLDYTWKPQGSRWIDFSASLWATRTRSKTNTAGGSPGDSLYEDSVFHRDYDTWRNVMAEWNTYDDDTKAMLTEAGYGPDNRPKPTTANTDGRFNTVEGQALYATNSRNGFTFSNKMKLHDKLDLTVLGDFQNEKLTSRDNFSEQLKHGGLDKYADEINDGTLRPNYSLNEYGVPRNGRRREFNLGLNFTFRPWDWLTLTAGGRYTDFSIQDDSLQSKTGLDKWGQPLKLNRGQQIKFARVLTPQEYQNYLIGKKLKETNPTAWQDLYGSGDPVKELQYMLSDETAGDDKRLLNIRFVDGIPYTNSDSSHEFERYSEPSEKTIIWKRDDTGRLNLADHPLYNRAPELTEKTANPINPSEQIHKYRLVSVGGEYATPITDAERRRLHKQGGNGWVPAFSATVHFSDYARAYVRYIEHLRYPSLFEGTYGFSTARSSWASRAGYGWRPEHAKNWELGYIHDLTGLWPKMRRADVRVNYFHNKTENVIDRDEYMNFEQFDLQRRSGVELSARFDSGKVFGSIGVLRNLKNEMCDEAFSLTNGRFDLEKMQYDKAPRCNHGSVSDKGYLATAIQPRWSAAAELGARFLGGKLESGMRFHYHSRVYADRSAVWQRYYNQLAAKYGGEAQTKKLTESGWQPVGVWDAYLRYKLSKNITAELVGTNLTNRYYLDPMTRSYMPAPGRTLRIGISGKF